jgi:hypothetical protein
MNYCARGKIYLQIEIIKADEINEVQEKIGVSKKSATVM